MRKTISAAIAIAALLISSSISTSAQTQPGAPAAQAIDTIKVIGCLKNEKDVAGLKPNIVERAGITEDYILTDVTLSPDTKMSGLGLAIMYEIEGIAESDLKTHLNHQIEVTGRLSRVETGAAATTASNRGDVPDFHATSFRMLAASCPMK